MPAHTPILKYPLRHYRGDPNTQQQCSGLQRTEKFSFWRHPSSVGRQAGRQSLGPHSPMPLQHYCYSADTEGQQGGKKKATTVSKRFILIRMKHIHPGLNVRFFSVSRPSLWNKSVLIYDMILYLCLCEKGVRDVHPFLFCWSGSNLIADSRDLKKLFYTF